jgi:methionyl-tRNA synthetase
MRKLKAMAAEVTENYQKEMDNMQFSSALSETWRLISPREQIHR